MAEILAEIGTLLELKGENPFKTRAYVNAARTVEGLAEPLEQVVKEDRLGEDSEVQNWVVTAATAQIQKMPQMLMLNMKMVEQEWDQWVKGQWAMKQWVME